MATNTSFDYPTYTKGGVALGTGLFALGILGHVFGPILLGPLPAWEIALLTYTEVAGILIAVLSVFVFGIALPLLE